MKHNTFVTHRKLFLIAAVLACACFSFPAPAYQFNTSDGANYGSTDSAFRVYWDNATDTLKLYSAASGTSGNPITWIEGLTMGTSGASLFQVDNDAGACTAAKLGRLRYNGTSTWEYCNNATTWTALGASPELSALTAATGTNTINSGANTQEWQWNTLAGATGLKLSSTSTAAASNAQKMLGIALSGANATSTQTTYAAYLTNTHTGTSSTNVGLYASASGGTNNYAAVFPSGRIGFGTEAPSAAAHFVDSFLVTGTFGSGDTTPVSGAGMRMMFIPRKAAFRAGGVTSTQWDDASVGTYSTAMGNDTTASGSNSTAMGQSTTASGIYSTAMGRYVVAGNGTAASGFGDGSMALGLIDDAVTITTASQVRGIQSMGIFMGDQDGLVQTGANTLALFGGKMIIDSAVPATYMAAPTYDLSFSGDTAAQTIGVERETTAATAGRDLTIQAGGAKSGGTNLAGGNLILKSGQSTGNGPSNIYFSAFNTGSPGMGTGDALSYNVARFNSSGLDMSYGTTIEWNTKYDDTTDDKYEFGGEPAFQLWQDSFNDLLRIQAAASGSSGNNITFNDSININPTGSVAIGSAQTTLAAKFVVAPPASAAVAGAAVITADACGTIKQITSTGNVTTNTTNTFTAPTASYAGCCMDVMNVDTADTITLDANAKFKTIGGADQALGPDDTVRVCSNGTNWYQVGAVAGNQ